jgi:NADH dehydrogenase FAD-containing subunit
VIGASPQRPPIPGATVSANGRIDVDAWLRPAGRSRLFALGDAAATGDPMTIVAITRQAPWLAKTLKGLVAGRSIETLAPYSPWPSGVILVPLGPAAGASQLPMARCSVTAGPKITSTLKGRDLFITRYRKEFGYGADKAARAAKAR